MIVTAGSPRPPVLADVGAGPGDEVDLVAAAVLGCPLVADLHPGAHGEVATYLAGRRVPGIRLGSDVVEVHVVARPAPTMEEVATQIRLALASLAHGRRVDVVIEDLCMPGEEPSSRSAREPGVVTGHPAVPGTPDRGGAVPTRPGLRTAPPVRGTNQHDTLGGAATVTVELHDVEDVSAVLRVTREGPTTIVTELSVGRRANPAPADSINGATSDVARPPRRSDS